MPRRKKPEDLSGIDRHFKWIGSKHDNRRFIAEHVPQQVREVRSPFFGSAAVELDLLRTRPGLSVRASDKHTALVVFWKAMLACPEDVANKLARLVTKKSYLEAGVQTHGGWDSGRHSRAGMCRLVAYGCTLLAGECSLLQCQHEPPLI
ncbi:unnamed protein product [Polarella glacialis]|uniref:site-specific DNA-methyltransferase (adenine-specific) n=1 Tax=Polarella glacialis TaxID=89957 RepID=A0A813JUN2_POLGL|nr:unnamed protein product [Polarella glacialis]